MRRMGRWDPLRQELNSAPSIIASPRFDLLPRKHSEVRESRIHRMSQKIARSAQPLPSRRSIDRETRIDRTGCIEFADIKTTDLSAKEARLCFPNRQPTRTNP